jgi:hypothetical protein
MQLDRSRARLADREADLIEHRLVDTALPRYGRRH